MDFDHMILHFLLRNDQVEIYKRRKKAGKEAIEALVSHRVPDVWSFPPSDQLSVLHKTETTVHDVN